jgi:hypothetical protein
MENKVLDAACMLDGSPRERRRAKAAPGSAEMDHA